MTTMRRPALVSARHDQVTAPAAHDSLWPLRAILTSIGIVSLLIGLWGLLRPIELADATGALFGNPGQRHVLALAIWGALLVLATLNTAVWNRLSCVQFVGAWIVVGGLWLAGMILLYLPPAGYDLVIAPIVHNGQALRTASLLAIAVGAALEGAALIPWNRSDDEQAPRSVTPAARRPKAA